MNDLNMLLSCSGTTMSAPTRGMTGQEIRFGGRYSAGDLQSYVKQCISYFPKLSLSMFWLTYNIEIMYIL